MKLAVQFVLALGLAFATGVPTDDAFANGRRGNRSRGRGGNVALGVGLGILGLAIIDSIANGGRNNSHRNDQDHRSHRRPQPVGDYYQVTASSLNMRLQPTRRGSLGQQCGSLPRGE